MPSSSLNFRCVKLDSMTRDATSLLRDALQLPEGERAELAARLLHDQSSLPDRTAEPMLERAERTAAHCRLLHWPVAFPEVFRDAAPSRRGFDAVVGNPPWDMVRGDSGTAEMRSTRRAKARHLAAFVRESGIYRVESRAHLNRYALFLERALQLVRPGGRVGFVLPAGVMSGAPVFKGTRVLAQTLIEYLEAGDSIDDFLEGFPSVSREQVIAFLEETKARVLAYAE